MTQDFGEGPSADFAETIIAASDAFNSAENAKHVTRTMLENARQGFWNGSLPPFGYRTVEVEKRGQRIKKLLQIEEHEAATVRQIFRLFLEGEGTKGPMGVKAIVSWLDHHGFRNANGNPFYTSAVHAILTRYTYSGVHYYNCRDGRTRQERPKSEWVAIPVPEIIPAKEFSLVQERLRSRRPNLTPPRITNSDVLLTGLLRCESCGGNMGFQARLTFGHPEVVERWDWNPSAAYEHIESDAVVDAFNDPDFHLGGTNAKGYIFGGTLGLVHNVNLLVRWLNSSEIDGPPYSVDVVQVDLNARF